MDDSLCCSEFSSYRDLNLVVVDRAVILTMNYAYVRGTVAPTSDGAPHRTK